jgi:hypothetical protein
MSNTRVSLDMNDEQMGTLNLVKAYLSKKVGGPLSNVAVIRWVLTDFAKKQRLEGNDAENNAGS